MGAFGEGKGKGETYRKKWMPTEPQMGNGSGSTSSASGLATQTSNDSKDRTPSCTVLDPTVMQIYPTGWKTGDSPCYLMIGNWLDGENGEMMSRCNIVLVLRAAGKQQNDDPAKPYEYGVNEWIRRLSTSAG